MLIVVKDWNVEFFFEPVFDLKTARRGNVFEVDAAESGSNIFHGAYDLVRVFRAQTNRKGINAAKFLEKHCLAFHHRHGSGWANIAEAEHRSAIGNNGHCVLFY